MDEPERSGGAHHAPEGRPHRLAYKPEHAVDLDTGAVVAADIHPGDAGDTTTLGPTLARAEEGLATAGVRPTPEAPAELIADKGYHAREGLRDLDDGPWKTRISEPKLRDLLRWRGGDWARRAVYNNRARLLSGVARTALKLRAELCERAFAHILARVGGADDPRKAIEDMRARTRATVRKHREGYVALRVQLPHLPRPRQPRSAYKVASEAIEALDDKSRLALADRHVNRLGMVTIFSAVLKIPKTLS